MKGRRLYDTLQQSFSSNIMPMELLQLYRTTHLAMWKATRTITRRAFFLSFGPRNSYWRTSLAHYQNPLTSSETLFLLTKILVYRVRWHPGKYLAHVSGMFLITTKLYCKRYWCIWWSANDPKTFQDSSQEFMHTYDRNIWLQPSTIQKTNEKVKLFERKIAAPLHPYGSGHPNDLVQLEKPLKNIYNAQMQFLKRARHFRFLLSREVTGAIPMTPHFLVPKYMSKLSILFLLATSFCKNLQCFRRQQTKT